MDSQNKSMPAEISDLIEACLKSEVDAITVANTIPVEDTRLAVGKGGLSGSKLFENTLSMINTIKSEYGTKIEVNACGGVSTGEQAYQLIQAGANSIQLYTSLVYEGPGLVKDIKTDLARLLKSQ